MKPLSIAIFTPTFLPKCAGAEIFHHNLASRLAEAGHGLWFDPAAERIGALGAPLSPGDEGLGVIVLRSGLHRLGYGVQPGGAYDEETRLTVEAFQRHWRPDRVDGIADGETRARLVGLLQLASVESVTGVLD